MQRLLKVLVGMFAMVALIGWSFTASAALCFNCGSGSSNGCKQCRARGGKDTQQARKLCKKMGCKITGYSSCSTAANVKVCKAPSTKRGVPTSTSKCAAHYLF